MPELSNLLSVETKYERITTNCQCATCNMNMRVTLDTEVIVMGDNLLSFKKPKQEEIKCPNCSSHYIRWERLKIIQ